MLEPIIYKCARIYKYVHVTMACISADGCLAFHQLTKMRQ